MDTVGTKWRDRGKKIKKIWDKNSNRVGSGPSINQILNLCSTIPTFTHSFQTHLYI